MTKKYRRHNFIIMGKWEGDHEHVGNSHQFLEIQKPVQEHRMKKLQPKARMEVASAREEAGQLLGKAPDLNTVLLTVGTVTWGLSPPCRGSGDPQMHTLTCHKHTCRTRAHKRSLF